MQKDSVLLILLLFFSFIATTLIRFSVLELLSPFTLFFNNLCLKTLPKDSVYYGELQALVCAQNFSTLQDSHLYVASGLIHLFVVSGAHLLILEKIYTSLNSKNLKQADFFLIIIFIYGLMCGLNAPILRSLIAIFITKYLTKKNIHWSSFLIILISGLSCLALSPKLVNSLSLQMSWIAALAVGVSTSYGAQLSAFSKQCIFFFLLLPTICFFQEICLSTIVINIALAPALEFILFPLALISSVIPKSYALFDGLTHVFKTILSLTEFNLQLSTNQIPKNLIILNWVLILLLHLTLHLIHVHKNTENSFEK